MKSDRWGLRCIVRPEGQVQLLLGHSEVQMTRHYLEGHEAPWERIAAGLNLVDSLFLRYRLYQKHVTL
jgi:integrase